MSPLIEVNADVKLLLKELRRIAHALELHLEFAYGVRATAPSKEELSGEPADVTYSSDELTAKHELDVAFGRVKDELEGDAKDDVLE